MTETVSFTQMKDGTREDYELLARLEKPYLAMTPDRVLGELRQQWDKKPLGDRRRHTYPNTPSRFCIKATDLSLYFQNMGFHFLGMRQKQLTGLGGAQALP